MSATGQKDGHMSRMSMQAPRSQERLSAKFREEMEEHWPGRSSSRRRPSIGEPEPPPPSSPLAKQAVVGFFFVPGEMGGVPGAGELVRSRRPKLLRLAPLLCHRLYRVSSPEICKQNKCQPCFGRTASNRTWCKKAGRVGCA